MSKRKNIFAKVYTPDWFEQVFVFKKFKNTLWVILTGKKLLERSTKKIAKNKSKMIQNWKSNQGNKLYVKWKGYNNSFNSCIDKKDIV